MSKPLEKIVKTYPKRGPLSQYRLEKSISFLCFRCNLVKKSKLITICNDNWEMKLCNGCYGRLISLYDIHINLDSDEEKIVKITKIIEDIQSQFSENLHNIEKQLAKKNSKLDVLTNKYLATAIFLKEKLPEESYIEWSPAIICLCKAVENEINIKFLSPLKEIANKHNLQLNSDDKRIKKIENFVFGKSDIFPELGTTKFFISLIVNSDKWRQNNPLYEIIKIYCENRPFSNWFYKVNEAEKSLDDLCINFRNIAAHISNLSKEDFIKCSSLVLSEDGILNKIQIATAIK